MNSANPTRGEVAALKHVQNVCGLLGEGAPDAVAIGTELNALHALVGKSRFAHYRVNVFRLKPTTASYYRRSARAFAGLDCLGNFRATSMFVLVGRKVTQSARDEAISLARAGITITVKLARAIVAKHSGAAPHCEGRNLQKVLGRVDRLAESLLELTPAEKAVGAPQFANLIALLQEIVFPAGGAAAPGEPAESNLLNSGNRPQSAQEFNLLNSA